MDVLLELIILLLKEISAFLTGIPPSFSGMWVLLLIVLGLLFYVLRILRHQLMFNKQPVSTPSDEKED